jgi:hypothetical protein
MPKVGRKEKLQPRKHEMRKVQKRRVIEVEESRNQSQIRCADAGGTGKRGLPV